MYPKIKFLKNMKLKSNLSYTGMLYFFLFSIFLKGNIHAQENKNSISASAPQQVRAIIDVTKTGAPVHDYVYGMFTELLGNIFDHGLWAEMLSDRKFFYPVDTTSKLIPENRRRFQNRWRPVGRVDAVIMDRDNTYVGKHTPLIKISRSMEYGIQQSGLAIRAGKNYS